MSIEDGAARLRDQGIALLRGVFAQGPLARLKDAADRCFEAIAAERPIPERYKFNRFSHSVHLDALMDFGCPDQQELVEPLTAPGLDQLFLAAMGYAWTCNMEHSWVRKKFAPLQAAGPEYRAQGWHQDGGLGIHFPSQPGQRIPMTQLLTCWIPLNSCGSDSPGLEFVRGRQSALLHFTELDDSTLRRRFSPQEFWAPELELGDGLVFLNSVLHQTLALPEMRHNRLSVEYRIFPR